MCCRPASTRRRSRRKAADTRQCRSGGRAMGDALRGSARSMISARMGGNSPEDERRFATAARVSEINLALYRTFVQPWSSAHGDAADGGVDAATASAAPAVRSCSASQNPLMTPVERAGRAGRASTASRSPPTIRSSPCRRRCRSRSSARSTTGATRRRRSAKRCSSRSMARRRCRPRSASIRKSRAVAQAAKGPEHRELLAERGSRS